MKTTIGVVPLIDYEKQSLWMLPGYMDGIARAGGLPVILPLSDDEKTIDQMINMCGGFLFTGGQDVSPQLYGAEKSPLCGECSPQRDRMETVLFDKAVRADKAIFGICRGIQFLNVCLGGTLYQDLPTENPSNLQHHQSPPYDKPVHTVEIYKDSPLYDLLQTDTLDVNSYHHQAIKTTASQLQIMAKATDGVTEAVCMPSERFVWAVQWHPELSFQTDTTSMKILRAFVEASAS